MVTRRKTTNESTQKPPTKRAPARTPEARENQLVAMAVDLVEKQLREGTASSQVISHYLKLGSSRERLEQERITRENELLNAKVVAMASQQKLEVLYSQALSAMRSYSGQTSVSEDDLDD